MGTRQRADFFLFLSEPKQGARHSGIPTPGRVGESEAYRLYSLGANRQGKWAQGSEGGGITAGGEGSGWSVWGSIGQFGRPRSRRGKRPFFWLSRPPERSDKVAGFCYT